MEKFLKPDGKAPRPAFVKPAEESSGLERIDAHYESKKEWKADPKGYFLIKVFYRDGRIGARYCTYDNIAHTDILGDNAEDVMQTIIREGLVTSLQHAAYLGHELHKAEVALNLGLEFIQCSPLDYGKKTSKEESDNLPE